MLTEIYDLTEQTIDENGLIIKEDDPEALALIEELGLKGQRQLNAGPDDEEIERNHYGKLSYEQQVIIYYLFPKIYKLENYNDAPIPLRILKEIKFCKDMFKDLYVCYAPPCDILDPILIGHNHCSIYEPKNQLEHFHIIARWGDALKPWNELFKDAIAKASLEFHSELKSIIAQCKSSLAQLDEGATPKSLMREPSIQGLPFDRY